MQPICDRELHEECGVFGVVGVPDAANLTYYGLHSLQHRGQEGCGIVSVSKEGAMRRVRGEGLVTEVFNEAKLANLAGDMAIGHVRYSTAGGGGTENIQPFLFHHNTGDFALAHNGNIVNADLLRNYLENKGSLSSPLRTAKCSPILSKGGTQPQPAPYLFDHRGAQYARRSVRVSGDDG